MGRVMLLGHLLLLAIYLPNAKSSSFKKLSNRQSEKLKEKCGVQRGGRMKIHQGLQAAPGQFPWAVLVTDEDGYSLCGGTLLSRRHVLTAAHCLKSCGSRVAVADDLRIQVASIIADKGKEIKVKSLKLHPKWLKESDSKECDSESDGDLAILEMKHKVPRKLISRGMAGFGCLPRRHLSHGRRVLISHGWGVTGEKSSQSSQVLLWARLNPLDKKECKKRQKKHHLPRDVICVRELNTNVCQKSSRDDERLAVVGVVSYGSRCSEMNKYEDDDRKEWSGGVFTDVRRHLKWICKQIGACYTVKH